MTNNMVRSMCAAALAYATRLGVAVFPVAASKVPLTPHGHRDATTDAKKIGAWWRRHPHANIGIRCDSFFVVDVDPRNGGDRVLASWLAQHGAFARTWEVTTGGGGAHYYFLHDERLDAIPLGRLDDGIDLKGAGRHYVLAPPSRSKSGSYGWRVRPRDTPLAKAPAWLLDIIVSRKSPTPAAPPRYVSWVAADERVNRARRYARAIPPAVSGQGGHSATLSAAVRVARGFALTEDQATRALADWNLTCRPPWSEPELRRKVREALRVGHLAVGALLGGGRAA